MDVGEQGNVPLSRDDMGVFLAAWSTGSSVLSVGSEQTYKSPELRRLEAKWGKEIGLMDSVLDLY